KLTIRQYQSIFKYPLAIKNKDAFPLFLHLCIAAIELQISDLISQLIEILLIFMKSNEFQISKDYSKDARTKLSLIRVLEFYTKSIFKYQIIISLALCKISAAVSGCNFLADDLKYLEGCDDISIKKFSCLISWNSLVEKSNEINKDCKEKILKSLNDLMNSLT
ncbi:MAG: hypothetical protein MHMPM18_004971, partial [Marteilia pararefringens]